LSATGAGALAELGEKLGEGATAEVFAYGEGRVVKLSKPGVERRAGEYEASQAQAVFESGAPCPAVFGTVEIDGRFGIIYKRLLGESLLQRLVRGEITPEATGALIAEQQWRLHSGRFVANVSSFDGWLRFNLSRLEERGTPADVIKAARATAAVLPVDAILCHGDLHSDNIFMTEHGPVPIDWISALMAHPLIDVARQELSLTILPIEDERPIARRFDAMRPRIRDAFISCYAELSHTTPPDLERAIQPFVVVMAALRLAEPACTPREAGILIAHIRGSASLPH
jgi:hypothetical protein